MQFTPDDAVVRFSDGSADQHGARFRHIALFGQHIGIIAVGGFHIGVKLDGAFVPFCAFGKLILLVISIADKK